MIRAEFKGREPDEAPGVHGSTAVPTRKLRSHIIQGYSKSMKAEGQEKGQ